MAAFWLSDLGLLLGGGRCTHCWGKEGTLKKDVSKGSSTAHHSQNVTGLMFETSSNPRQGSSGGSHLLQTGGSCDCWQLKTLMGPLQPLLPESPRQAILPACGCLLLAVTHLVLLRYPQLAVGWGGPAGVRKLLSCLGNCWSGDCIGVPGLGDLIPTCLG